MDLKVTQLGTECMYDSHTTVNTGERGASAPNMGHSNSSMRASRTQPADAIPAIHRTDMSGGGTNYDRD